MVWNNFEHMRRCALYTEHAHIWWCGDLWHMNKAIKLLGDGMQTPVDTLTQPIEKLACRKSQNFIGGLDGHVLLIC